MSELENTTWIINIDSNGHDGGNGVEFLKDNKASYPMGVVPPYSTYTEDGNEFTLRYPMDNPGIWVATLFIGTIDGNSASGYICSEYKSGNHDAKRGTFTMTKNEKAVA